MKIRKQRPKEPAAPASGDDRVLEIETGFRNYNHLAKILEVDGVEAVGHELDRLIRKADYDASHASISAMGSIAMIDTSLFRDDQTQKGRSKGGYEAAREARERASDDYK